MFFDKLCGIVEKDKKNFFKNFPNLKKDLKYKVKLFQIDELPINILNYHWTNYADAYQNFFLPFPMIAVDDNESVTLMFDTEENQKGLSGIRKVIYFTDEEIFTTEFYFNSNDDTPKHQNNNHALIANRRITTVIDQPNERVVQINLYDVMLTVQEILYLNTPNRFVLEERPINGQGRANSKKIPRSNRRSKYIFLSPGEIRKRYLGYDKQNEKKGTKKPHERRRHLRKYPDDPDRFPIAHGKEVTIPACWIGTKERRVGNKIYKVRLDL